MTEHEATRTLVKSPPELWAECSDAGSLGRHLAESFGEIRITRLEPETAVAWEGEKVSGTVRIEPSAWGTRVTLTAQMNDEAEPDAATGAAVQEPTEAVARELVAVEDAVVVAEPEPVAEDPPAAHDEIPGGSNPQASDPAPAPEPKRRFMGRFRALFRAGSTPDVPPAAASSEATESEAPPEPEPVEAEPPPAADPAAVEVDEPPVAVDVPEPEPEPELTPTPSPAVDAEAGLAAALDSLGQAHHRPFSRA